MSTWVSQNLQSRAVCSSVHLLQIPRPDSPITDVRRRQLATSMNTEGVLQGRRLGGREHKENCVSLGGRGVLVNGQQLAAMGDGEWAVEQTSISHRAASPQDPGL